VDVRTRCQKLGYEYDTCDHGCMEFHMTTTQYTILISSSATCDTMTYPPRHLMLRTGSFGRDDQR
jgi:hypothetical protein